MVVAKLILTILALVVLVGSNGCVRNTPLFRRLAAREEAKLIKQTDEAIAQSPGLQELDRLCTKEIPIFAGFAPRARFAGPSSKTSLHYYYRSSADYSVVKRFYLDYFSQYGWFLTRQKEDGWGPDTLEFKKSPYRIIISHGGLGDADYAMDCDKLSDSGEPLPNKSLDRSGGSVFRIKLGAAKVEW